MAKALTADAIRQSPNVQTWPVEVWGGQVWVRELSLHQRWDYIRTVAAADEGEPAKDTATLDKPLVSEDEVERGLKAYKWLILNGVCDEAGEPLFTAEDWDWLEKKSALTLEKLANEVLKHNGLGEDAVDDTAGN